MNLEPTRRPPTIFLSKLFEAVSRAGANLKAANESSVVDPRDQNFL